MRIVLGVEYCGAHYKGWQKQPQVLTVQQRVEEAVSQIAAHPVEVICAGRTDAGVHAKGQVIHFDTAAVRADSAWTLGVNRYLPADISIRWMQKVSDHFCARYSARARRYRYIIENTRTRPALDFYRVGWVYTPLNDAEMDVAAQSLIGEHDFTSFRGPHCQSRTPIRQVRYCHVYRERQRVIIEIEANAFLHHMVRNIVGCLIEIGKNKQPATWLAEVLKARSREVSAAMAPAQGLYLMAVKYPEYNDFASSIESNQGSF